MMLGTLEVVSTSWEGPACRWNTMASTRWKDLRLDAKKFPCKYSPSFGGEKWWWIVIQSQSVKKITLTKEIQENQDSEYLPTKGWQFRHDKAISKFVLSKNTSTWLAYSRRETGRLIFFQWWNDDPWPASDTLASYRESSQQNPRATESVHIPYCACIINPPEK